MPFAPDGGYPAGRADPGRAAALEQALAAGLTPCFQPIVALATGELAGHEALIRGPVGSALESPLQLFAAARDAGVLVDAELACAKQIVRRFVELGGTGKIFLNLSPQTVVAARPELQASLAYLKDLGLPAHRMVIEISETEQSLQVVDFTQALPAFRALGFAIAIDDLGEGFSSLRLWSELQPEYVKVDKHFVQGLADDALKLQFLRAMQSIAETCGTQLVAEGVERESDLRVLRDLGIAFAQGYLIGRPAEALAAPGPALFASLRSRSIAVFPQQLRPPRREVTTEKLLVHAPPMSPAVTNDEILEAFEAAPDLHALPVVAEGRPMGLINRHAFVARFVRPFRRELYGRRSCTMFMDGEPLVVEKTLTIHQLSQTLIGAELRHLSLGFVITDGGRYAGLGTGQDLIREITQMQLDAARYANPLTMLPGNVPIDEHIERLLAAGAAFAACYCDLNHFKPFNDAYGYRRGDDMIKLTARTLAAACDPACDFIGHIGGDDFMLLMQSDDWEARCRAVLDAFDEEAQALFAHADRLRSGFLAEDRLGNPVTFPLTSLAIGAVVVAPGTFASHLDVASAAAEAKKQAKRAGGSGLFVERRKPG